MERQTLPNDSEIIPSYAGHGLQSGEMKDGCTVLDYFSHMVLEVTDLERSEAWYRDVIGMEVVGRNLTAEDQPHSLLQMNTGQFFILVQKDKVAHRLPPRSFIHHAFLLTPNQYQRAYQRLKELGYELGDTRIALRPHGEYSIDIADPDGHRYQLQTYGPEAKEIIKPGVAVVNCGLADDYKVGDVRVFKDGNFFLVRLPEGFLALTRWCTHMNGIVVYQQTHWRFYCPNHGATYDRRGNATSYPAECAMRLNPISFSSHGEVLVNTDEVIERSSYQPEQAVLPPQATAEQRLSQ